MSLRKSNAYSFYSSVVARAHRTHSSCRCAALTLRCHCAVCCVSVQPWSPASSLLALPEKRARARNAS